MVVATPRCARLAALSRDTVTLSTEPMPFCRAMAWTSRDLSAAVGDLLSCVHNSCSMSELGRLQLCSKDRIRQKVAAALTGEVQEPTANAQMAIAKDCIIRYLSREERPLFCSTREAIMMKKADETWATEWVVL